MNKYRCPKCKSFTRKAFNTHTGGECKRCKTHITPVWYTEGINTRPWPMPNSLDTVAVSESLRMPWETREIAEGISAVQMLNQQMGLELPDDTTKTYWVPFDEFGPEYGPVDITPELAIRCAGMQGVDELHNALLIICGSAASAVGTPQTEAIRCANLSYYLATGLYVGPGNDPRDTEVETAIRESAQSTGGWWGEGHMLLMDAVAMVFAAFDVPHTVSVEYIIMKRGNPPFWVG